MSETGHRRRWMLGAAGAGVAGLAGCGLFQNRPAPPAPPDPLQPLLDEARALAAAYERAMVDRPELRTRLAPLADDHRAHVAELSRVIGAAPSSGPSAPAPTTVGGGLAELRAAEQAAQKTAAAACRDAAAGRAALVGSIAACRATHAEALR